MNLKRIKKQLDDLVDIYCEKRDNPSRAKRFWRNFEYNPQNKRYENQFKHTNPGTFRISTSFSIPQNEQHSLNEASEILGRTKSSIVEEAIIIWLALNFDEIKNKGEQ